VRPALGGEGVRRAVPSHEPAPSRTQAEIAEIVDGLTAADWARLRKAAAYFSNSRPIEPDDLLQEAFRRALEGGRTCPTGVDFIRFMIQAMRSIAHGEMEKAREAAHVRLSDDADDVGVTVSDPAPDAEECLTALQELHLIRVAIIGLFDDDVEAQFIVEGLMDGIEGEELRALTGLSVTAFASRRRLIRRRIDRKFPDGWKS
jgi:DNA-directed RNA polymerase specialized sigma24 family protein